MIFTIKRMRQLGFNIKITHQRRYMYNPHEGNDLFITKGQFRYDDSGEMRTTVKILKDNLLKRLQQMDLYLTNSPDYTDKERFDALSTLFELDNLDGFTRLSLLSKNGDLIGVGCAKVNSAPNEDGKYDAFNKKIAVNIALGRAIKEACDNGNIDIVSLRQEIDILAAKESVHIV